ncbi:MAG TPA: hypothetical protein PK443_02660 [bacterium]|nr:hypothetical protein [bacterium]
MEQKISSNQKKPVPFLETTTGRVVLMATTSIFSGFCAAFGGSIYNKITGTGRSTSRDENVLDFPARTSKVA